MLSFFWTHRKRAPTRSHTEPPPPVSARGSELAERLYLRDSRLASRLPRSRQTGGRLGRGAEEVLHSSAVPPPIFFLGGTGKELAMHKIVPERTCPPPRRNPRHPNFTDTHRGFALCLPTTCKPERSLKLGTGPSQAPDTPCPYAGLSRPFGSGRILSRSRLAKPERHPQKPKFASAQGGRSPPPAPTFPSLPPKPSRPADPPRLLFPSRRLTFCKSH